MTLHATRRGDFVDINCTSGSVTVKMTEHRGHAGVFWQQLGSLLVENIEDRARKGYGRYVEHCGGKSVHGEPLPTWDEQAPEIREHWIAAFTE